MPITAWISMLPHSILPSAPSTRSASQRTVAACSRFICPLGVPPKAKKHRPEKVALCPWPRKDQEKKKNSKSIQEKLQNKEFEVRKLSTENKELYGSVKPTEIAKILFDSEKIKINPSMIQPVKEIRSIGTFKVILNLHPEIQSKISIRVVSEENSK